MRSMARHTGVAQVARWLWPWIFRSRRYPIRRRLRGMTCSPWRAHAEFAVTESGHEFRYVTAIKPDIAQCPVVQGLQRRDHPAPLPLPDRGPEPLSENAASCPRFHGKGAQVELALPLVVSM